MSLELSKLFTEKTKLLVLRDKLLEVASSNDHDIDFCLNTINKSLGIPKRSLYIHNGSWYYRNGNAYFFKDLSSYNVINELLGECISKYFELKTVNYFLAKVLDYEDKPTYGIASLNFCNPKLKYKDTHDLGLPLYSLSPFLSNLDIFDYYFKNEKDKKEFILSLKKLFIRDFFTGENDRKGDNLLFEISNKGIKLAPLFDYEWSFSYKSDYYSYDNSLAVMDTSDIKTKEYLKNDLEFQELFEKLLDINILDMLKELEDKYKLLIANDDKDFYLEQEERVKELVQRNLIK